VAPSAFTRACRHACTVEDLHPTGANFRLQGRRTVFVRSQTGECHIVKVQRVRGASVDPASVQCVTVSTTVQLDLRRLPCMIVCFPRVFVAWSYSMNT
jgi:hypothetical protein